MAETPSPAAVAAAAAGPVAAEPPPYARRTREYLEVTIPIRDYFEALRAGDAQVRAADERWLAERDLRYQEVGAERDQRYAEVKAAEEKALKVKETADLKALDLASQIQTYKDEKANELREQISSERGLYASRGDLASMQREIMALIKPLAEFVTQRQGDILNRTDRRLDTGQALFAAAVLTGLLGLAISLYAALH